jgi:hypothetical protein
MDRDHIILAGRGAESVMACRVSYRACDKVVAPAMGIEEDNVGIRHRDGIGCHPTGATIPLGAGFTPGEQRQIFELPASTATSTPLHYTISMCVELCYAESCGTFLQNAHGGKAADFFVNMSNDGIFQRAVEARAGIARSSNTGISGFVKPTGEMYGEVVNARGQSWTGLGAPELPRIAALVKFRSDHAAELATNPALAAHVTSEIAAIEELRRAARVTGQSTQRLYVDSRHTLYSRIGDIFSWALVIFTAAGFLALLGQKIYNRGLHG